MFTTNRHNLTLLAATKLILCIRRFFRDAEKELKKIPFFVRGKARRNTETYAASRGVQEISIDTLYAAKAHYAQ